MTRKAVCLSWHIVGLCLLIAKGAPPPRDLAAATAIAPGRLGTLLIGSIIGEWWHLADYFWYFLPGTAVPQKSVVIYARAIYHAGFVLILFSLATVMAPFIDYFIVKKVLEL